MAHYSRDPQKQQYIGEAEERANRLLEWMASGEDVRDRIVGLYIDQCLLSDVSRKMLAAKKQAGFPADSVFWDDVLPSLLDAYISADSE